MIFDPKPAAVRTNIAPGRAWMPLGLRMVVLGACAWPERTAAGARVRRRAASRPSTRSTFSPITARIVASSRPASSSASVSRTVFAASNGTAHRAVPVRARAPRARRRSAPPHRRSSARSTPRPRRRTPSPRTRSPRGRRSRRSPPAARRTGCASCRAIAAHAGVRRDDRAGRQRERVVDRRAPRRGRRRAGRRAPPSRASSSRPRTVSPPFSTPCAEPPNAVSKKCAGEIIRTPRSATASRFARVVVERVRALDRQQPGGHAAARLAARRGTRRGRLASADHPERALRSAPPARAACCGEVLARAGSIRPHVARRPALRERERAAPRRCVSSLRSMLRPRGVLTAIARTWSATLPSISRGTSTGRACRAPAGPGPNSSESACRSATRSVAWSARAALRRRPGRRRSRPGSAGPRPGRRRRRGPGATAASAPTAAAPAASASRRGPARHAPNARPRVGRIRSGTL